MPTTTKPHRAPTARRFQAALAAHGTVRGACDACGFSLQALRKRRTDGSFAHPELVAVTDAHNAARQAHGEKRIVWVHLPLWIIVRLDRYVACRAHLGAWKASRSAVARDMVTAALRGPLPEWMPEAGEKVALSLGNTWRALQKHVGGAAPGVLRAILAEQQIDW